MNPKLIFAAGIIISLVAGVFAGYLLSGYLTVVMVGPEAKDFASKLRVDVIDNGLTYNFNPDTPTVKVLYWQSGGKILAESDTWVDGIWQLDLGGEDKPTSNMQGDRCDIIVKIFKLASDNTVHFEVLCGGSFVKRIFYNDVLKLDTSSGIRFVMFQG